MGLSSSPPSSSLTVDSSFSGAWVLFAGGLVPPFIVLGQTIAITSIFLQFNRAWPFLFIDSKGQYIPNFSSKDSSAVISRTNSLTRIVITNLPDDHGNGSTKNSLSNRHRNSKNNSKTGSINSGRNSSSLSKELIPSESDNSA